MKKSVFLTILLIVGFAYNSYGDIGPIDPPLFPGGVISMEQALARVKEDFVGKDVDYYGNYDLEMDMYNIYVDLKPMAEWGHEGMSYSIRKTQRGNAIAIEGSGMRMIPPSSMLNPYVSLDCANRYGDKANVKPFVKKVQYTDGVPEASKRTYAIILQGYENELTHTEVAWNDCSFIYQVLVNKYGVPKEHVYPFIGKNMMEPSKMKKAAGGIGIRSFDLDGDGFNEYLYSVCAREVYSLFNALQSKIEKDDHLLVFVNGPCFLDSDSAPYIPLTNYMERLYPDDFAALLKPFCEKLANVNVVMGQKYSGLFAEALSELGCVVAASSSGYEDTWAYECYEMLPFNGFLYYWTSAVNGADFKGASVHVDKDKDGHVNMSEAFDYANHMCQRYLTPRYRSTPEFLGDDLAFTYLPPSMKVYIKDDYADKGIEPNANKICWESPSIWVRNKRDSIEIHENPYVSDDHDVAYVYVWIHNRGKEPITGGKWVQLNWALCSTVIDDDTWLGKKTDENEDVIGYSMVPQKVATSSNPLMPGDSVMVQLSWNLQRFQNADAQRMHYCLFARVLDDPYVGSIVTGPKMFNPNGLCTHAQKNVTLLTVSEAAQWQDVYVRNVHSAEKQYSLEIAVRDEADAMLFQVADVDVKLNAKVSRGWENGGSSSIGIRNITTGSLPGQPQILRCTAVDNRIDNIKLEAGAVEKVSVRFVHKSNVQHRAKPYKVALIQRDEDGNILGGETYIIGTPLILKPIEIEWGWIESDATRNDIMLKTDATEFTSLIWRNENGDHIGGSESVDVKPSPGNMEFSVVGFADDGTVGVASITLDDVLGIESISSENGVGETLHVKFRSHAGSDTKLVVSSALETGVSVSKIVDPGSISADIYVGNMSAGIYVVTMVDDGAVIDSRKFVKR